MILMCIKMCFKLHFTFGTKEKFIINTLCYLINHFKSY